MQVNGERSNKLTFSTPGLGDFRLVDDPKLVYYNAIIVTFQIRD